VPGSFRVCSKFLTRGAFLGCAPELLGWERPLDRRRFGGEEVRKPTIPVLALLDDAARCACRGLRLHSSTTASRPPSFRAWRRRTYTRSMPEPTTSGASPAASCMFCSFTASLCTSIPSAEFRFAIELPVQRKRVTTPNAAIPNTFTFVQNRTAEDLLLRKLVTKSRRPQRHRRDRSNPTTLPNAATRKARILSNTPRSCTHRMLARSQNDPLNPFEAWAG
jgi:hypothetical protein